MKNKSQTAKIRYPSRVGLNNKKKHSMGHIGPTPVGYNMAF